MKLVACGFNGCVYSEGDKVYKKTNGPLSRFKNEIELGNAINDLHPKKRMNILPLLDYWTEPTLTHIPKPFFWNIMEEKFRNYWLDKNINAKKKIHTVLVYPKLEYTLSSVYYKLPVSDRYKIGIDILNALKVLKEIGYANADIHTDNIMFGNGRWYMIDYGMVKKWNMKTYLSSILNTVTTLGNFHGSMQFPKENLPKYKKFKEMVKLIKDTEIYKNKIKKMVLYIDGNLKNDVALELLWIFDYNLASDISGYTDWISTQPHNIVRKYGKPHNKGISNNDYVYALCNMDDIDKIIKRFKSSLNIFIKST